MKGIRKFLDETYRNRTTATCLVVAVLVALADFVTGSHVQFPILYVLPAIMAAWMNRKGVAYTIAIVLSLVREGFFLLWNQTEPLSLMILNTLIRLAALVFIVYLVDRTASQARRLKVLEGFLRICASCKRIKNEKGEYEQMEKYITEHSQAVFSHGLCPECVTKLYPEYVLHQKK